jgi:HSP20 family molecular chaperone IbpA
MTLRLCSLPIIFDDAGCLSLLSRKRGHDEYSSVCVGYVARDTDGTEDNLKVDVVDKETDVSMFADLPGVAISDVELQVANGMLNIVAQRRQVHKNSNEFMRKIERSFGTMKRSIRIPEKALTESAKAWFENGVLSVHFKKRPGRDTDAPRKLRIRYIGPDSSSAFEESEAEQLQSDHRSSA